MGKQTLEETVSAILAPAGVRINGTDPWDIQIHNEQFYKRVLSEGTLGLGESYMDGWWDVEKLDEFTFRVMRAGLYNKAKIGFRSAMDILFAKLFNMQIKNKAADNAQKHYDI